MGSVTALFPKADTPFLKKIGADRVLALPVTPLPSNFPLQTGAALPFRIYANPPKTTKNRFIESIGIVSPEGTS